MTEYLLDMAVFAVKLIPAILIGGIYIAALIWQGFRVATAPNLLKLNALAILATTALLFLPPYEGYAAVSRAVTVSLFPIPFLIVAVIADPKGWRLLSLAHLLISCFIFWALFQGAR